MPRSGQRPLRRELCSAARRNCHDGSAWVSGSGERSGAGRRHARECHLGLICARHPPTGIFGRLQHRFLLVPAANALGPAHWDANGPGRWSGLAHPLRTGEASCTQHPGPAFRGPSCGWRLQPHPRRQIIRLPAGDQDRSGGPDIRQILIITTRQRHRGDPTREPKRARRPAPQHGTQQLDYKGQPGPGASVRMHAPQIASSKTSPVSRRQFAQQKINSRPVPAGRIGFYARP